VSGNKSKTARSAAERSNGNLLQSTTKEGKPTRPASWILREEIMRNGALRSGDCLSEASLSHFSGMQYNFSKIRAALTFCFFCVKAKEKRKGYNIFKQIIIFAK